MLGVKSKKRLQKHLRSVFLVWYTEVYFKATNKRGSHNLTEFLWGEDKSPLTNVIDIVNLS